MPWRPEAEGGPGRGARRRGWHDLGIPASVTVVVPLRRSTLLPLSLSCLLVAGGVPPLAQDPLERADAVHAKAAAAIERGARWLALRAGSCPTPGHLALTTLTLVHCGRGLEDRVVRASFDLLVEHAQGQLSPTPRDGYATYGLALAAMAIHELYAGLAVPLPEQDRIAPTPSNPLGLPPRIRVLVGHIARWLVRTRLGAGLWSYGLNVGPGAAPWLHGWGGDLSNSQYALLGLWACARCGERVDEPFLTSVAEALLANQAPEGPRVARREPGDERGTTVVDQARGFGYPVSVAPRWPSSRVPPPSPRDRDGTEAGAASTGSMTAGGLAGLLIVKALLLEQEQAIPDALLERLDRGIWDAIAWLTLHYTVESNPWPGLERTRGGGMAAGPWHAYYLYGLERAMVVAGRPLLGVHDWYVDGAELLLDTQARDGSWSRGTTRPRSGGAVGGSDPLTDTCFALLFLKRASLRPRAPLLPPPVTPPTDR